MNSNEKCIGGSILKKIRRDLSLKQKDLKCEGLKNISRIETGAIEMSYTIANRLCNKINEIIKEKSLVLDYPVTIDLFMGRTSVFRKDLLDRLEYCEDGNTIFEEINQVISNLDSDPAIKFMLQVLKILSKDIYKNTEKICDYCYKLLTYNLTGCIRIDISNYLIKSYFFQDQHVVAIGIGKSFENEVSKNATLEQKEKFFGNIANSYFQIGNYNECQKMLKSISNFTSTERELYFLLLKAVCKSELGNKDEAIKIYESIIVKAMKINDFNRAANSYSNIGDLYLKSDINLAKENINKSMKLVAKCTNRKSILECHYNKFLLSIEEKNIELINKYFKKSMLLAANINDLVTKNKLVSNSLKYYWDSNMNDKIPDFICKLKNEYKYNIEDSTFMSCIKHISDNEILYKVIEIAQNQ